jgi:DNA-binding beta-propeller fold protein YncE
MRYRVFAILGCFVCLSLALGQDAPKPIGPVEAAKKVNEEVTLQMEVKSAALRQAACFLNSEADFKDANNFTIFIDKEVLAKFNEAKIEDPAAHFKGKTVQVKGKVILYRDRPEIKVSGPEAVKVVQAQPAGTPYKVLKKYVLGGEGAWDYLSIDAEARRLYITRGDHVMVMDLDNGKIVGDIQKTMGVHGVALAPRLGRGFTSNGGDATVTIFDLTTLKETARVKVGASPDAILYDPATDRVFTFNAKSQDATAIAAGTGSVLGTVKLGGRPETGVSDGKGMVYVNIQNSHEVAAFDAKSLVVKQRWPMAPGELPTGLGIDAAKRRLFVSCRNDKMMVLEADTGKVLGSVPIGKGTDACIFDARANLAFSSNKDGTLTVVDAPAAGPYRVLDNVATQVGAKTMALDPKTHQLYLATAQFREAAGQKAAPVPGTFTILVVGK